MRLLTNLLFLLGAATTLLATDNGLQTVVTWDPYSLTINGERVWIFAGEFHYPRLPVPELWRDVLQKFKANGLNTVNTYFFWSYHSAREGVFDFESGGKDVQRLFDMAKEEGMYVIARPGPYANAEASAGGLALWTTDGSGGSYRTDDETYYQAWLPWIQEMGKIIARNQITEGGPVILDQIENELQETRHEVGNYLVNYMDQIINATREVGIVVPTSSNEKGMRSMSWSVDYQDVGGTVDVYGLDSYPGGFSCTNVNSGFRLVRNYYEWFQNYSSSQPEFWPEFEGGYFQPWGGYFYDECLAEHDPAFPDVYYKNNIGQRGSLLSIYMNFGGTNWGNFGAPVVYTSYDYSAPLRETREVQLKFKQQKLIGLFTRVSQDLRKTEMESNGTGNAVSTDEIFTWVLRNPDTGAGFYTLQHDTSSSRDVTNFDVYLDTSIGSITATNVQLNGRQSKIVTTDYRFGEHNMLYCTSDIAVYGLFKVPVIVLYLEAGQVGEFAFANRGPNGYAPGGSHLKPKFTKYGDAEVKTGTNDTLETDFTTFTYTQTAGSTVIELGEDGTLIYLLEKETAWNFYAPPTTKNPNVKPDEQIFVLGPYNVRSASLDGSMVTLVGDNANTTTLEVYAGSKARHVTWNGKEIKTKRTKYGALIGGAPGATDRNVELPGLSWVGTEAFPERYRDYDDSAWVVCNKTSTLAPQEPLTLPVLYSSDYGYYSGVKIYRGYFDGTDATSANITAQGGDASGFSAWLNGAFVGNLPGNGSLAGGSALLDFSNAELYETDNVLTVVTDFTGFDQTNVRPAGGENPRGILGAWLYGGNGTALNFTEWKIQGNAGGNANIDPVRGPMNEDGLHGTRVGWHLPGYEPSGAFTAMSPSEGVNASGINWYISHFDLDIDADLDVPIGLELGAPEGTVASVQIYMNGYQYGKYMPAIGPQSRYPFPPGVINNRGSNTLAMSIWAQTEAGAQVTAELFSYNVYQTGFKFSEDWSYLQPGWDESRLQYA